MIPMEELALPPEIAGLLEVEPFVTCWEEGYPEGLVGLRYCDVCYESLVDDEPCQWRTFYYDPLEHLSVCEKCVHKYLETKP